MAQPRERPDHPTSVGPYRIECRLGSGRMGEMYRAYDERLEREVAVKQLRPDLAGQLWSDLAGQLWSDLAGQLWSDLAGQPWSDLAGQEGRREWFRREARAVARSSCTKTPCRTWSSAPSSSRSKAGPNRPRSGWSVWPGPGRS